MGYGSPDPYYQPEAFGLTVVGSAEWTDYAYEFDTTVVWVSTEDSTVFYWADDSGCSCPTPFEDFRSLEDLERGTRWDVISHVGDRMGGDPRRDSEGTTLVSAILHTN